MFVVIMLMIMMITRMKQNFEKTPKCFSHSESREGFDLSLMINSEKFTF